MSTASAPSLRYIKQHLRLYQQQAAEEAWKGEHEIVMKRRELEELVGIGLSLFNSMRERAHFVQDAIARGSLEYGPDISAAFVDGYREWLKPSTSVDSAIRWFESKNFQVENADEFRDAVRQISLHAFDVDGINKADRDIREGRGKPLAAAISELQGYCQS